MQQYIMRRILIAIPTLLLTTFLIYSLINLAPGDPLSAQIQPTHGMSEETYTRYKQKFGLDKPFITRYLLWLKNAAQGDFGRRTMNFRPVAEEMLPRMKNTVILAGTALVLGIGLGIIAGIISAIWRYTVLDHVITVLSFTSLSIPVFFTAFLLLYFFSYIFPIFPGAGTQTPGEASFIDLLSHLILPVISLALFEIATFTRYTRSGLLEVLSKDYIRTASSKGLGYFAIIFRHGLRNAVTTVVTMIGFRLRVLIAGAVVTETVFNYPGMGTMFLQAMRSSDYPLLMGYTTAFAVLIIFSNLLVDLSYAVIDPRVTYD